jgi:hypothetical protein
MHMEPHLLNTVPQGLRQSKHRLINLQLLHLLTTRFLCEHPHTAQLLEHVGINFLIQQLPNTNICSVIAIAVASLFLIFVKAFLHIYTEDIC